MARTNALHSLYGGKVSRLRKEAEILGKALAGNVGGQKRNQTVLTPRWFLNQLISSAHVSLGYDPCTTAYNPTKAAVFSTEKTNGLAVKNWARVAAPHGFIYVNPPYDQLKVWLHKMFVEAVDHTAPIYALVPFRPWRTWFCELTARFPVYSLAPFAFVGEKSAYPAPLCVVAYNLPEPVIVNPRGKNMITGLWNVRLVA
jgi:hypothetical protein